MSLRTLAALVLIACTPRPAPPVATHPTCRVLFDIELAGDHARIRAQNLTAAPYTFTLDVPCAGGVVPIAGLPANYDASATCNRGPCLSTPPPRQITLEPRSTLVIAEETLSEGPCQPRLAPGRYTLTPVITRADFCTSETVLVVEPPRPAPVVKHTPERVPEPYACEQPQDCTLACPSPPGCCANSCGCRHAMNRRFVDAHAKEMERTCQRKPCPAVGCAYEPAGGATCVAGRCVAIDGPGF